MTDKLYIMPSQSFSLHVSPQIGNVSAELMLPDNSGCIVIIAHGAGAGMNHTFMVNLATELSELDIGTFRFNFPFIENKKKRPDFPAVAHKTIEMAFQHVQEKYPDLPIFLSGKSFGGRMSSQYLAENNDAKVEGIIFYGFPLHALHKPSTERAEHLKRVKQPMLFLQGTRDALAEWSSIQEVCSSLAKAKLVKLEGADHSFKKGKENLVPELARQSKEWINTILN
jgi:predicted alpha/beta-hydrolase family hydrolase